MILRPVRPVSAFGPPISKRPVGLTRMRASAGVELRELREHGVDDLGPRCRAPGASRRRPPRGAAREIRTVSTRTGLPSSYSIVTCVLPSGRRYGIDARLADVGQPPRQPVRHRDRHRHQLVGLVAGEADHHALVARARRRRDRRRLPVAVLERVVDPERDVGRLLLDRDDHAAGLAVDPERGVRVADVQDRVAHDRGMSTYGLVVISPATNTTPVVTSVSHATRPCGSTSRGSRPGPRRRSGRRACRGVLR